MYKLKEIIRILTPPILIQTLTACKRSKYGWHGNYDSWDEAKGASTGYDDIKIANLVKDSLLKVKKGEVAYERDSVLFDEIEYSWPLLAGLMYASAKFQGSLSVVDFGGSLGSSYYQNKKFLDRLDSVLWNIIEQEHFVKIGKELFEHDNLRFFRDIESCKLKTMHNVLLLSSVIQYIEQPYSLIDKLLTYSFRFIIIDRTPFSLSQQDEIKVQVVPPSIYRASYPCWFLSEIKLNKLLSNHGYVLVESFISEEGYIKDAVFKGAIWEKICENT